MKKIIKTLGLIFLMIPSSNAFSQVTYTIYPHSDNTVVEINGTSYPNKLHPNRVNIVVLADGYDGTSDNSTYPYFEGFSNKLYTELFGYDVANSEPFTSPFYEYQDYFNYYWVWVESSAIETGTGCIVDNNGDCDHSQGECDYYSCFAESPSHFGTRYDNDGLHRLIQPSNPQFVLSTVQGQSLFNDNTSPLSIVISANTFPSPFPDISSTIPEDDEFGGGALLNVVSGVGIASVGRYSYQLNDANLRAAAQVGVHEMGHTFSNLLDEYWYDMAAVMNPCNDCNEAPNRTGYDAVPRTWEHWLSGVPVQDPPIGFFNHYETNGNCFNYCGAEVDDYWKPTSPLSNCQSNNQLGIDMCMMENISQSFCAICKEAIIERIHQLVNPIETFSHIDNNAPLPQTPTAPGISGEIFSVDLIEPTHQDMQVKWTLNGTPVATVTSPPWEWSFDCTALSGQLDGTYTLIAEVRDLTDGMVRSHLHSNPPFFDHDDHFWTQKWDIIWNGEFPNLLIRDFYNQTDNNQPISDVGDEPWQPFPLEGWFFDYTSDIKVTTSTQTGDLDNIATTNLDENDQTAYVHVRVQNIGCTSFSSGANLHVYTSVSGGFDSWPANWIGAFDPGDPGYEITHDGSVSTPVTIPTLAAGATATINNIAWTVEDMTPNVDVTWNPCLLARIEGVTNDLIDGTSPAGDNLTNWIRYNNNIAMRNLTVDETSGFNGEVLDRKPYLGGYTYLGNTDSQADTFDIFLQHGLQPATAPTITDEAEVIVYFKENGWDVSGAITSNMLKGFTRLDSTLFLATSDDASISGIPIPADTVVPVFIGAAFLTQEVGDSTDYVVHLNQRRSTSKDTVHWAHHYLYSRTSRNLFSANAGNDVEILVGDSTTLSASSIGETTIFNWYDGSNVLIDTIQSIVISPNATTTYKVEVIAEDDGYKDYDNVIVTVTKGQITSVIPNPTSTTTVVSYKTANITTASLKVVEVNTGNTVDNISITVGTGTKTIDASGYNTGAHIITLVGDGNDLDTETLVVQ